MIGPTDPPTTTTNQTPPHPPPTSPTPPHPRAQHHYLHQLRHPHPLQSQAYHRAHCPNPRGTIPLPGTHVPRPHIQFPYPPRGSPHPSQPRPQLQPLGPNHPSHQIFQAHFSHYPPSGPGPGMRPISLNNNHNHNLNSYPFSRPKVGSGSMSAAGVAIDNNDNNNNNANINILNSALNKVVAGEGVYVTLRDRQVRMSEGSSIYALCRSWLKNGSPEESQSLYGGVIKSLPKPSPVPISGSYSPKANESDDEAESDKDDKSVENLDAKELLKRHVKRAKRVRARLREERLQRIARYKNRLGLLLPPLMEQCGNDTNIGEADLFERARD